jgi:hypothetical protein
VGVHFSRIDKRLRNFRKPQRRKEILAGPKRRYRAQLCRIIIFYHFNIYTEIKFM